MEGYYSVFVVNVCEIIQRVKCYTVLKRKSSAGFLHITRRVGFHSFTSLRKKIFLAIQFTDV